MFMIRRITNVDLIPGSVTCMIRLKRPAGSVNHRSLIQTGINGCHGGNVDDGIPSHFLPYIDDTDQPPEIPAFSPEEHRLLHKPQGQKQLVHGAGAGEYILRHADNNDHAQEVRQIGHGLDGTLESPDTHLIEKNRQKNRGPVPKTRLMTLMARVFRILLIKSARPNSH